MKTRKLFLNIFFAAILGLVLQLILHEFGHVLFAICTGNRVDSLAIGSTSYTGVTMTNENAIPIISLGAFILPIVFYIGVSFIKNTFVELLNMFVGTVTAIQMGINGVALLTIDNMSNYYNTYDLEIFVNSTNSNPIVVSIITLFFSMVLLLIVLYRGIKVLCVD